MNHGDAGSWDDQKVHLEESHTTPSQSLPSQSWKVWALSPFGTAVLLDHLAVPLPWGFVSVDPDYTDR